ncbi:MAG: hypothetical protein ACM3SW_01065 [Actinomycetota bacterium]
MATSDTGWQIHPDTPLHRLERLFLRNNKIRRLPVTTWCFMHLEKYNPYRGTNGQIGMHKAIQDERCTVKECLALFTGNADHLHLLCDILTFDPKQSQLSFDDALSRALEDAGGVFREYMLPWARRMVIKSCIRAMWTDIQNLARNVSRLRLPLQELIAPGHLPQMTLKTLQSKLIPLDVLSRFVVVMRIVENYSRRETALLLGIDEDTCTATLSSSVAFIFEPRDRQLAMRPA